MNSVNTNEIESAFNDLIEQLKDIKNQSDIAEQHKENATILNQKLQEFYTFSKNQDVSSAKILNDYYSKIKAIHESVENQSNLLGDKIIEYVASNDKVISAVNEASEGQSNYIGDKVLELITSNNNVITSIHESVENQSNLLSDKIDAFILSNNEMIIAIKKYSDKQAAEISQVKTRNTIGLVLNIVVVILVVVLLAVNII